MHMLVLLHRLWYLVSRTLVTICEGPKVDASKHHVRKLPIRYLSNL